MIIYGFDLLNPALKVSGPLEAVHIDALEGAIAEAVLGKPYRGKHIRLTRAMVARYEPFYEHLRLLE